MKDENELLGPPPVVTIILTAPALILEGATQFIVALLNTLKDVAFIPPNVTALAPLKLEPIIVREVPPIVLPDDFEMLAIVGGATVI